MVDDRDVARLEPSRQPFRLPIELRGTCELDELSPTDRGEPAVGRKGEPLGSPESPSPSAPIAHVTLIVTGTSTHSTGKPIRDWRRQCSLLQRLEKLRAAQHALELHLTLVAVQARDLRLRRIPGHLLDAEVPLGER